MKIENKKRSWLASVFIDSVFIDSVFVDTVFIDTVVIDVFMDTVKLFFVFCFWPMGGIGKVTWTIYCIIV